MDNLPPYDFIRLRDEVQLLRKRRSDLLAEQSYLRREIIQNEELTNAYRQQLNILQPLDEIRQHGTDSDNFGLSPDVDEPSLESKDRKLELEILNTETRLALIKLESDALMWELKAHKISKSVRLNINSTAGFLSDASFITKSAEDIEACINFGIGARLKLNLALARELDVNKSEKRDISNNIARVRAALSTAIDEISGKSSMVTDIHSNLQVEDARIEVLREEEKVLKTLVENMKREQSS
jgi:hypothetical protein